MQHVLTTKFENCHISGKLIKSKRVFKPAFLVETFYYNLFFMTYLCHKFFILQIKKLIICYHCIFTFKFSNSKIFFNFSRHILDSFLLTKGKVHLSF